MWAMLEEAHASTPAWKQGNPPPGSRALEQQVRAGTLPPTSRRRCHRRDSRSVTPCRRMRCQTPSSRTSGFSSRVSARFRACRTTPPRSSPNAPRKLPLWRRRGWQVDALVLETTYAALETQLVPALRCGGYDAVLMLGVAPRRKAVTPEMLAHNRITRLVPDAAGRIGSADLRLDPQCEAETLRSHAPARGDGADHARGRITGTAFASCRALSVQCGALFNRLARNRSERKPARRLHPYSVSPAQPQNCGMGVPHRRAELAPGYRTSAPRRATMSGEPPVKASTGHAGTHKNLSLIVF